MGLKEKKQSKENREAKKCPHCGGLLGPTRGGDGLRADPGRAGLPQEPRADSKRSTKVPAGSGGACSKGLFPTGLDQLPEETRQQPLSPVPWPAWPACSSACRSSLHHDGVWWRSPGAGPANAGSSPRPCWPSTCSSTRSHRRRRSSAGPITCRTTCAGHQNSRRVSCVWPRVTILFSAGTRCWC